MRQLVAKAAVDSRGFEGGVHMATTEQRPASKPAEELITGLIRVSQEPAGSGFRVRVLAAEAGEGGPIATTFTHANGAFTVLLPRRPPAKRGAKAEALRVVIEVQDRTGRTVAKLGPVELGGLEDAVVLDADPNSSRSPIPIGPAPVEDLSKGLGPLWAEETAILSRQGIRRGEQLVDADLSALADQAGIDVRRLGALRLHAEMSHAPDFDPETAEAFASIGITSREDLAGRSPAPLMRAIVETLGADVDTRRRFSRSKVYGLVGFAKGIDPEPFSTPIPVKKVIEDTKVLTDAVLRVAPAVSIITVAGLLNAFNRFQAVADARALMDAAGVGDLSSLGTFRIKGRRVIHPGTYVASPKFVFAAPTFQSDLLAAVLAKGGSFKHLSAAKLLDDAIHLVPNPVTDAVIIGSVVEFVEDGKLVIGSDVTSLTIITEEILYSVVNEIAYEGRDRSPQPRAPMSPAQAATGNPRNDRNVYSPGSGNTGRDGGTGSPGNGGAAGFGGDSLGPAPDVTIYVQRTPQGLPDLRLGGRRGGSGQAGQHGGAGSDGARGRGASSGACYCHREPGHGGRGGIGGPGGNGGIGGTGGTGSTLKICTLPENIAPLATGRPYFIDLAGGPGGNGGSSGRGGPAGRGGSPGDDSWPWCEEEPSRVGSDGATGMDGSVGPNGAPGVDGQFTLQPITLSDWNAVFNQPWIVRLEPWAGPAGSVVHVVARNLTADTAVVLGGVSIAPTALDVAAGTLDFTVPSEVPGGLRTVMLRLGGVAGAVYSNTVNFRVLPVLGSLSPTVGVPGTPLQLTGSGFTAGSEIRFGSHTLPATFDGATQLSLTLPDHENIVEPSGPVTVALVNPDAQVSNSLSFALTLDVVVRVKGWRVFPDIWVGGGGLFGGPGPLRDDDDVRDVLMETNKPADTWTPHHVVLQVDPNVGIAVVPADWASSWPRDDVTFDENQAVLMETDSTGAFRHFEPGAVNIYFVDDIDDWTTHAYTYRGSETRRQTFVIYEDTPLLSDWEEAHVAAHELGHVFGLPHVCGDESDVTFGRACTQGNDKDFLMYPSTNFWTDEGNTLTAEEARIARRVARLWHGL